MPVPVVYVFGLSMDKPQALEPLPPLPTPPLPISPMEIWNFPPETTPPPGRIFANYTGFTPPGYLVCNGAEVSRTTYETLFKIFGTYYGAGNGTTTFSLPNLSNGCDANIVYIIKYEI